MVPILSPETVLSVIRETPLRFLRGDDSLSEPEPFEREQFFAFLETLSSWLTAGGGALTFRGEKKASLRMKLVRQRGRPFPVVLSRLFAVGEKARRFVAPPKLQQHLTDINDVSEHTFNFIAKRLAALMAPPDRNINFARRVFRLENNQFQPFNRDHDRQALRDRWLRLTVAERSQLRDYYLYLLHTTGSPAVADISYYVSTSRDIRIAEQFALARQRKRTAIIILYWIPQPLVGRAVERSTIVDLGRIAACTGFPQFTSDLYPFQSEIAVKGALFPHYMLGIHDLEMGHFVVNPHLVAYEQSDFLNLLNNGAEIDHQTFVNALAAGYYHHFVMRGAGYFEEHPVAPRN